MKRRFRIIRSGVDWNGNPWYQLQIKYNFPSIWSYYDSGSDVEKLKAKAENYLEDRLTKKHPKVIWKSPK